MRYILLITVVVCLSSICFEQGVRCDDTTTTAVRENDLVQPVQRPYLNRFKSFLTDGAKHARNHFDNFIKPKKDFVVLFTRLHRWYTNYKLEYDASILAGGDVKLPAPLDLMAARFVAIDREFQAKNNVTHELVRPANPSSDDPMAFQANLGQNVNSIDSMGYLYDVLERTIDGLERESLVSLMQIGNGMGQTGDVYMSEEAKNESEDLQIAMDRLKSAGTNMAKDALQNEVFIFMRVLLSQMVANHLAGTAAGFLVGGPLGSMMFAAANTPVLGQYLAGLRFRAVVGLVKTLNPGKWVDNLRGKPSLSEASH